MDTIFQPIDQFALTTLLQSKRSQRVHAFAQASGWHLIVRARANTWVFARDGKSADLFPALKDLGNYLSSINVAHFLVDISALDQSSSEANVKARLLEAKDVAADDEWMDQRIKEALDGPDTLIPNSVVKTRAAARRAELQAGLDKEKS